MDVRTTESMLRAAEVVAATLDPDLVLEHILEGACDLLRARAAVVWALEEDGAAGRFRARGFTEAERRRIESRLLHRGDSPSAEALVEETGVARITLAAGGRAAGVLVVSCPGGRPLTARRRECLRRFAPLAAAALARAAEHERTRRALATVSESQAMLGAVIQHASDGILVLDDHLRVMLANRAAEMLTGHPAGTLLGRQCFDFLRCYCGGAQPVCEERCPLNPLLSLRREPAPPAELRLDTPSGHRWVGVSWATIASGRGSRPLTVLVLRDITAAKEADQMKSAIISLVSHELRTPLTSIRMLSELLVEHAFDPREARPLLSDIAAESRRLSRLVEQVLEVARLEGGRVAFTPRPVDLPPLLAAAVELLRPHAPRHAFHLELPKDLPAVLADPDRVRQILDNLLSNAVKYSPHGGRVTVRVRASGGEVEVAVSDEGLGLPPEGVPAIFERFGRAGGAERAHLEGLGLGLHIARSLAVLHGGRLWASDHSGPGATFCFTLPLASPTYTPASDQSSESGAAGAPAPAPVPAPPCPSEIGRSMR